MLFVFADMWTDYASAWSNIVIAIATIGLGIMSGIFVWRQNAIIQSQVDVEKNALKVEVFSQRFDVFTHFMDFLILMTKQECLVTDAQVGKRSTIPVLFSR